MTDTFTTDPDAWEKKAKAFTVRSHRHLWGKNNEDPLAFLFLRGLNNLFIKDQYLGWNKFGQERPFHTWGVNSGPNMPDKFLLPSGIVIPYIKDKRLRSVFIHCYNGETPQTVMVPGSQTSFIILGNSNKKLSIITDVMDGLYLFQEQGENSCVLIACRPDQPLEPDLADWLVKVKAIRVYQKNRADLPAFLKDLTCISDDAVTIYQHHSQLTP
jgi:hypothetical protein